MVIWVADVIKDIVILQKLHKDVLPPFQFYLVYSFVAGASNQIINCYIYDYPSKRKMTQGIH